MSNPTHQQAREKYVGFGVVRDKNGNPRVDDPNTLHPIQIGMLSTAERQNLGLWTGCFCRDAAGYKRMTKVDEGVYQAEEPIRAISEIFDGTDVYRVAERHDMQPGIRIAITLES